MILKRILYPMAVLLSLQLSAQKVEKIEPPMWWTGFENSALQLMVYGENITLLTPEIEYPGVTIESIVRAQSPNYLFVNLKLAPDVEPGTVEIRFRQKNKTVQTINYTLNQREEGSAKRQSFSDKDVIYLLFPDRFANGDPSNDNVNGYADKANRKDLFGRHGGDIKGIVKHLDYLNELGISALWTTPMLEDNQPRGSYHHYATTDFYKIDPRFGSNEDYKNMVDACHQKGIKVIIDLVPNHCGSAHPWMKDLPFQDWINGGTTYTQTNYQIPTTNDPYASKRDRDLNFNGWFVSEMPDLNQNNPFMLTYLKQYAVYWLEYAGIDGIRVDTYPYNDPDKAAEWTKAIIAEYPNMNIVGECWQHSPAEVAYWQSGSLNYNGYDSGLPSVMDFSLHDQFMEAFNEDDMSWNNGMRRIWHTLTQDYFYADPYNLVTLLENHDTQRFSTIVENDMQKYKLGMMFLLTTRGIPQLYYGSEILMGGDKNVGDGDIRRDMPGGWAADKRSVFSPDQRTETEAEVFNYVSKLIKYRTTHPVLQNGKLMHYIPENNVYVYFRFNEDQTVMIVLNNNPEEQTLELNRFSQMLDGFEKATDIMSREDLKIDVSLKIKGKSGLLLELN
ncbi:glycoside hydrolase family 13 protein [Saccharicrinis sp. FJH54]|uniref:glycoside hydrolase family 13 protein n=1 Tax=Saccharicrinis sp. FJH54 TaxID=3344665 RepID=UPI0035D5201C